MVPRPSEDEMRGYEAVRRRAGAIDRRKWGRILLSGRDRASYLHALLTNDIVALQAGAGCYAAYLTPQGRMIADLWVYELGDAILLTLNQEVKDTVFGKLDQFVFSEDVQLQDATDRLSGIVVAGPAAASAVGATLSGTTPDALQRLPDHGNLMAQFDGRPVIVLRVAEFGVPAWELLIDVEGGRALDAALSAAGVEPVDEAATEALRIEAGVPRFHADMDEDTIPLEAGIESRAISLTKGCYVGQEVIIRVLHRGHGRIKRRLIGLVIDGDRVPPPGAVVQQDDRQVGRVTSSALSPTLGRPIALAYLHHEVAVPGARVAIDGAGATVTAPPFVSPVA